MVLPVSTEDHVDGQIKKRGRTCKVWRGEIEEMEKRFLEESKDSLFGLVLFGEIAGKATKERRRSTLMDDLK